MQTRRIFTLIFITAIALSCLISCEMKTPPTDEKLITKKIITAIALSSFTSYEKKAPTIDEKLITERIETFLTAYNTGNMEGVLKCLDAKARNGAEALMKVLGALAGGVSESNFNLADFFSLSINTTSGDFTEFKITNIHIDNATNATATTTMKFVGNDTQTIYFIMIYENEGWYIHDMTDRNINSSDTP